MVVRERFWQRVVVFAALVALVVGSIGIVSLSARSFPSMAQTAVSELVGSPGGGEQDAQVEFADEAYWPKDWNCFWMDDGNGNVSLICVPKLSGASNLQAFSSEPVPGGGRPSASNQPFTPHSRL